VTWQSFRAPNIWNIGVSLSGLARKRAMLGMGASPSLSQLLMEAKAEGSARAAVEGGCEDFASAGPLNYSRLFEEYHGERNKCSS